MIPALRLRIASNPTGGWALGIDDGASKTTWAELGAAQVRLIMDQIHAELAVSPVVAPRKLDAARTKAEEAVGRALATALEPGPLAREFAAGLGAARAQGCRLLLCIDTDEPQIAGLPWELLADSPQGAPLEEQGQASIARLSRGAGSLPRTLGNGVRAIVWSPTRDDLACETIIAHLEDLERENVIACVHRIEAVGGRLPPPERGWVDVLHVVCHGSVVADQGVLLVAEGDVRAVGTAAHLLQSGLDRMALVVLDVCRGGAVTRDHLASLANRLVYAGAHACACPAEAAHVHAVQAFARGLHRSLRDAGSLVEAVAAGRREVRALADPLPDARWCNHRLLLANMNVAASRPVAPVWTPNGWLPGDPSATAYLELVRAQAEDDRLGFVGIEHLARALVLCCPDNSPLRPLARAFPLPPDDAWRSLIKGFRRGTAGAPVLVVSPRLRALGAALPVGFRVEDLWARIVADPHHGLDVLSRRALPECLEYGFDARTLDFLHATLAAGVAWPSGDVGEPATAIQILWGPHDGFELAPQVGDILGRWDAAATVRLPLYEGTAAEDRQLSRQRLRWLGPGRMELLGTAEARRVRQGSHSRVEPGVIDLLVGDVLQLTPGTWIRGLADRG